MYDTSVKVPALFAQPGRIAPAVRDALVSGYDVYPTLLDYCGIADPAPRKRPGRSFRGILEGEAADPARNVVVYDEYGPVRMVRTREWKYVHRTPGGPHELYDLARDPGERANRIDDPAAATIAAELRGRLDAWFAEYVDPLQDAARTACTGCGQLGPVTSIDDAPRVFADVPVKPLQVPPRG